MELLFFIGLGFLGLLFLLIVCVMAGAFLVLFGLTIKFAVAVFVALAPFILIIYIFYRLFS